MLRGGKRYTVRLNDGPKPAKFSEGAELYHYKFNILDTVYVGEKIDQVESGAGVTLKLLFADGSTTHKLRSELIEVLATEAPLTNGPNTA